MRVLSFVILMLFSLSVSAVTLAQRCVPDGSVRYDSARFCLREVITDTGGREMDFTALAVGPDGTLYAARPYSGQVMVVGDNGAEVLFEGLDRPSALAAHETGLYVLAAKALYRWQARSGLQLLMEGLPQPGAYWHLGLGIGPDTRLYVGLGAAEGRTGAILSMTLDGEDQRVEVQGLVQPTGLVWVEGVLWFFDLDLRSGGTRGYRLGTQGPQVVMDLPGASPVSAALHYTHDALPGLRDTLVLAQRGSYNRSLLDGYALVSVSLTGALPDANRWVYLLPDAATRGDARTALRRGLGVYPHYIYGAAFDPVSGWLYLSVGGGTIYALTPAQTAELSGDTP